MPQEIRFIKAVGHSWRTATRRISSLVAERDQAESVRCSRVWLNSSQVGRSPGNETSRSVGGILSEQVEAWRSSESHLPCKQRMREALYADERALNIVNGRTSRHWVSKRDEESVLKATLRLIEACRQPEAKRRASPVQVHSSSHCDI